MKFAGLVVGCSLLLQAGAGPEGDSRRTADLENQAPIERREPRDAQIPVLKAEARLVNVAVSVADGMGAPVGGLGREDFDIKEDGAIQKIAFFERESSTPLSIVLAIDASESVLRNERLEREAAKRFVRGLLRDQDELDLMDFADVVREIVPFTNDKKKIESGLGELQHGDATALYDAIYLASDRLASRPAALGRRRVLVVITDGGDTVKGIRYSQAIEEAQRAGAIVYSLIIVPVAADAGRNTGGEHALIQMANDTGGKYFDVQEPKELEPAFRKVSDDLRTQYVLGYYAPQKRDSAFRTIRVEMKVKGQRDGYTLRYRTGYFADAR